MSARAGIVVTGTEVLTGRVSDRNGPWLAERLRELGVDIAYTTIVGDRPEDMLAALRFMAERGMDVVLTSGGWAQPPMTSPPRWSAAFRGARWCSTRPSPSGSRRSCARP